jgi:acyl-CoA hydrolase
MSNVWSDKYREKLRSADEAVQCVKSGDVIFMGEFIQVVESLDEALAKRKDELKDVIIVTTTRTRPLKCVEADPKREVFTWDDWHFSGVARKFSEQRARQLYTFHLSSGPRVVAKYNKVDVVFIPRYTHG